MRARSCVTVAFVTLALAAGAHAAPLQQGPPADVVAKIAAGLCKAEQAKLGESAFAAKYGSAAACAEQRAAEAEELALTAIAACREAGHEPRTAGFQACVQEKIKAAAGASGGGGKGGEPPAELASNIANGICKAEEKKLGKAGFREKYGTAASCKDAVAARAASVAKDVAAKCKGAEDRKACVKKEVQALLKPKEGAVPAELVGNVAAGICKAEEKKLGKAGFRDKYGSAAACKEAATARATSIAKDAAAKCRDADDRKGCVKKEVQAKLKPQGGAAPAELVANVATGVCKAEEKKLGKAGFRDKYGSAAACKEAVAERAAAIAKEAAAACKDADDRKACVKKEVQARLKSGRK